jgi:hypothetical protein
VSEGVNPPGPFNGKASYRGKHRQERTIESLIGMIVEWDVVSSVASILSTAPKEPWEPKFRSFKLSNKIADAVTRVKGEWTVLEALVFEVVATSQDFKANIPISADSQCLDESITTIDVKGRSRREVVVVVVVATIDNPRHRIETDGSYC